jgi:hypothetical protein
MKPRKTAYIYRLINSYRQNIGPFKWIRIWLKKAATTLRYHFHPVVLTYMGDNGLYRERRFASFTALHTYLAGNA